MITPKESIMVSIILLVCGFFLGYLSKNNHNTKTDINIKSDTLTTIKSVPALPISGELIATVDTIFKYIPIDTGSFNNDSIVIGDIFAKGDTLLEDSSYIAVEYSYEYQRFKFLANLKQRIITNTIKETITVTNTIEEQGILYIQLGAGIVVTKDKIIPGVYAGIGYSITIL